MADPTDTTSMALPPRPPCPKCQSPARLFTSILDADRYLFAFALNKLDVRES